MTRTPVPHVHADRLLLVDGAEIALDSPAWERWLAEAEGGAFRYRGDAGTFTARRERQRNGWYWYAYRRVAGRLRKAYLGRPQDLSLARLEAVAVELGMALPQQPALPPVQLAAASGLLATKLHPPPARPDLVPRPHLARRLAAALDAPLTTVVAPAGFGKTTLVAAFIERHKASARRPKTADAGALSAAPADQGSRRIAWLSLDQGDNDPARFWTYAVAAFEAALPGVSSAVFPLLQSPQVPVNAALAQLLNTLAAAARPLVLVLDDYHLIEEEAVRESVAFVVERLPATLHLVILSRMDPALPLARLRARGQLHEIRAADLRFSVDEAEQFLGGTMGLTLAPEAVAALDARTEGWAAGLQLAALAMRDRADHARFIESFAGSHRSVADYLAEEVIARQPAQVQRFLLRTSILERMCAELCDDGFWDGTVGTKNDADGAETQAPGDAIGNAQEMLEYLERSNLLLVPLDDERRWYRYHHLFGEMLRDRLRRREPQLVPVLHRRAAAWYRRQDLITEAVDHALAAEDYALAADMIEEAIASVLWVLNEARTLVRWIAAFPPRFLRGRPRLLIGQAWARLAQVRIDDVEQILRALEANGALDGDIRGQVLATRSFVLRLNGDIPGAVAACMHALEDLPEDEVNIRSLVINNLENAYLELGDIRRAEQSLSDLDETLLPAHSFHRLNILLGRSWVQRARGQLREAYDGAARALRAMQESGHAELPATGLIHVTLADLRYEWNDLDGAEFHARAALALGDRWWNNDVLVNAYLVLGRLQVARGEAAETHFAESERLLLEYNAPRVIHEMQIGKARAALIAGRLAEAQQWVDACGLHPDDDPQPLQAYQYEVLARALVSLGHAEAALRLLERLIRGAEMGEYTERLIELHKVQALALHALGRDDEASLAIGRALALGAPGGFIRTFADDQPALAHVIERFVEQEAAVQPLLAGYALRVLGAFPSRTRANAAQPEQAQPALDSPERLTPRELDVLRLLAEGRGNQQIAAALVVAVSTVRSHVKSIYAKLGAAGRVQAVVRARSLGLLDH